nr:hypothetical protein [Ilumatobacteraceae bacterium]
MLDPSVDPHRPSPRPGPLDRIGTWVRWFGLGRLVTAAVSVVVVVIGGWWLVRPPQLPVEATLPLAGAPTSVGLPLPTASASAPVEAPASAADLVVHVA